MSVRQSYIVDEERKVLFKTIQYDEKGNIVSVNNHIAEPPFETISTYNEKGDLVQEIEVQEGIEVSKFTYEYDDQQRITSQKQFISDYLYSEVKTTYTEKGFERITTENEEEVEKLIRTDFEGEGEFQNDFFVNGEFKETQIRTWDEANQTFRTRILDEVEDLFQTTIERFNEAGKELETIEESASGDLVSRITFQYEGNISLATYVDYREGYPLMKIRQEFDDKDRCILYERLNDKEGVMEHRQYQFDEDDRLIGEVNRLVGDFDSKNGVPLNNYRVVHEYQD